MSNLLDETVEIIVKNGYKHDDITFIGSEISGYSCSWTEFLVLANRTYDSGFGSQKVANDLIIVFNDGARMYRYEYDGSEWWEMSKPFIQPAKTHAISTLFTSYGDGLGEDSDS